MLVLRDLLKYDNIVVQVHDTPDADAIASGYALYEYLKMNQKTVRLIYGGAFEITKSNLVLMIESLNIPIEYVTQLTEKPKLLVTVDCQYGERNVQRFEAEKIAIIDHHQVSGELPEIAEVRSSYGSCATVMRELLREEGIDVCKEEKISTALYYGLMTDTGNFTEIVHPADKDLRDEAEFTKSLITLFRNSNLSLEELHIAADALNDTEIIEEYQCAFIEAAACDPNILGIISDMLLEVNSVNCCVVYSVLPFGVKLSVRSCVREIQASEMAAYLTKGYGGGGGHLVKAGGMFKREMLEQAGIVYEQKNIREFIKKQMIAYHESADIISAETHAEQVEDLKEFSKKKVVTGYVVGTELAPVGTSITIRTMEGDLSIKIEEDTYINIGVIGEVYPIKKSKFDASYEPVDEVYEYPTDTGYESRYIPSITNSITGEKLPFVSVAKCCVALGGQVYARKIERRMKVFTAWDADHYYLGKPGDYLAVRKDDMHDFYIIQRKIFEMTYEEVAE